MQMDEPLAHILDQKYPCNTMWKRQKTIAATRQLLHNWRQATLFLSRFQGKMTIPGYKFRHSLQFMQRKVRE